MTLPSRDTLATLGGPLEDYAPETDPTTDLPASAGNQIIADVAMMTMTAIRAWCQFTGVSSGTPTLVNHMAQWGNALAVAPTLARTSTGVYTVTWPATVQDALLAYQTLNFLAALAPNVQALGLAAYATVLANVATVNVFNTTNGNAADTTGNIDVYVF